MATRLRSAVLVAWALATVAVVQPAPTEATGRRDGDPRFAADGTVEQAAAGRESFNPMGMLKAAASGAASLATSGNLGALGQIGMGIFGAALEFNQDRKCVMCEFLVAMTIQRLRVDPQLRYAGPPDDFPYTAASAGGVFGIHGDVGVRAPMLQPGPKIPNARRAPIAPVVRPPPPVGDPAAAQGNWQGSVRPWGAGSSGVDFGPGIRSLGPDYGATGGSAVLGPLDPNRGVARVDQVRRLGLHGCSLSPRCSRALLPLHAGGGRPLFRRA